MQPVNAFHRDRDAVITRLRKPWVISSTSATAGRLVCDCPSASRKQFDCLQSFSVHFALQWKQCHENQKSWNFNNKNAEQQPKYISTLRAISHWHEYSLRVLAEKVISLVLPLSIHIDAIVCIAQASIRRYLQWKQLARWLVRVNWRNWLLFHLFWRHFKVSHPSKW